jgi:hypothetical protein
MVDSRLTYATGDFVTKKLPASRLLVLSGLQTLGLLQFPLRVFHPP